MVLAGTPATMTLSGTSFVTTVPAATMAFSPMVTPGRMIAPAPIHALRFITLSVLLITYVAKLVLRDGSR